RAEYSTVTEVPVSDPLHFEEEYFPFVAEAFQVEDDTPLFAVITLFLGRQVYQVADMFFPIQQIIEQFNQVSFVGSSGENPFEGPVGQDVDVLSPLGQFRQLSFHSRPSNLCSRQR